MTWSDSWAPPTGRAHLSQPGFSSQVDFGVFQLGVGLLQLARDLGFLLLGGRDFLLRFFQFRFQRIDTFAQLLGRVLDRDLDVDRVGRAGCVPISTVGSDEATLGEAACSVSVGAGWAVAARSVCVSILLWTRRIASPILRLGIRRSPVASRRCSSSTPRASNRRNGIWPGQA